MRIDEINLLGQFKITGNTGNDSQAIGMSGGSTSFIDVVASGGGSSEGLVKRSGYNYVIVEATGDALTNGVKLQAAYTNAVTLLSQIGTPGIDNRVSILLTPGDYDLGGNNLSVNSSFTDIVGISQNPLDTIVRASGTFSTIVFDGTMDFGLYNIDLRSGETDEQVTFYDGGGTNTTYLRMKNVVLSGNGFFDPVTSYYSFYDLDGEFEDITVLDGCNFAVASNSLTGTFKNIKIGSVDYAFYTPSTGTLTGTYKNITISNLLEYGFYGIINGTFEDIKVNCNTGTSYIFSAGIVGVGTITGYFKNIIISGSHDSVFYAQTTGIYENIEISTAEHVFESADSFIDGTFKNIKIGDVTTGSVFKGSTDVLGTYSNIEIGNVITHAFYGSNSLNINIKDLKVGNVGGNAFFAGTVGLSGTYENITIGDVTVDCFVAINDNISGTFKNIIVGNVVNTFFTSATDLSGTFENIKSGDVSSYAFYAGNSILGTFKKISVKSANEIFYSNSSDINGIFDDIYIGSSNNTFYSSNTLTGTFSNMEIGNCNRLFTGANGTSGYYDGITIGSASNNTFEEITTGTYKNIKIGSCDSFFTSVSSNITPTLVENIEVGEVTSGNFIHSGGTLGGTYKNIKVGSVTGKAFYGFSDITGTYSNIEVGHSTSAIFYCEGSTIFDVNVNGAKLTSDSDIFLIYPSGAGGTIYGKINKLTAYGNDVFPGGFGNSLRAGATYLGATLTNSTIIKNGSVYAIDLDSTGSIERCKVITNTSSGTGLYGSGQVIYTMTNQTIDVSGATQNVTDSDITS
jgi:hypothetical protein